jgi:hypothetical protein
MHLHDHDESMPPNQDRTEPNDPNAWRAHGSPEINLQWRKKERIARFGRELKALDFPNEASFYTSGRPGNEAAFLYGLFARQFGTNNLPDCSNTCHESSGTGLMKEMPG